MCAAHAQLLPPVLHLRSGVAGGAAAVYNSLGVAQLRLEKFVLRRLGHVGHSRGSFGTRTEARAGLQLNCVLPWLLIRSRVAGVFLSRASASS